MEPHATRRAPGSSPVHLPVVGLLSAAILFAVLVLSPFHPRSVEWDPSHGHVVVGGDGHERARALATHFKNESRYPRPLTVRNVESERCDIDGRNEACVLSIRVGTGAAVAAFGIAGGIVATAHHANMLPSTPRSTLRLFPAHRVVTLVLPVPDPPPRAI